MQHHYNYLIIFFFAGVINIYYISGCCRTYFLLKLLQEISFSLASFPGKHLFRKANGI